MADDRREQQREILVQAAKAGRTTTYAQAASQIGLDIRRAADANALTGLLRSISESEHQSGRPLLSVVCVMVGVKRPGQGFFDLAKSLGLMAPDQDNRSFFEAELQRVHAYWKNASE